MQLLRSYFTKGSERSNRTKKNIAWSFIIKGCSIIISFVLVPVTLKAISAADYGIWLTISSFIGWFSFFDVGLGNGLRNKFTEALAKNEMELVRIYVSTTYAIIIVIAMILTIVFFIFNSIFQWEQIFNASPALSNDLSQLLPIVFILFTIQFVFQLISTILLADQRPAINNLLGLLGSMLTLIGVSFLNVYFTPSLLKIGIIFTACPVIVILIAHIYFYSKQYKMFSPSIKYVNWNYGKELSGLGIQFFIIQIAVLILFSTSNMIITHYFGPEEVTSYNLALKYFGIISSVFILISTPFWSAITEAHHRNDIPWIRNSVRKLMMIWALLSVGALMMLLVSEYAYSLWVGNSVTVSFSVSLAMFVFVVLSNWNSIFATYLNGTGKIRLQLYSALFVSIINIPLSLYFAAVFGVSGIVFATVVCVGIGSVWAPIQYRKIMNNSATGIWAK